MSNTNETRADILREMRETVAEIRRMRGDEPDAPAGDAAAMRDGDADPEPLSAILASFRAFALRAAQEERMVSPESVLLLADKAEAAAERERSKWERERRAYEKLHDCFWEANAIQNIVRQMLGARDDLRRVDPKEADDLDYYAHELMKAAKKREQAPAEGPSSGANPDAETVAGIRAWLANGEVARCLAAITDTDAMHDMLTAVADRIKAAEREREALVPKPDPNWKDICARCNDGDIEPRFCKYYGEPNGCNSPIYGEHPTTEKSAGNAAAMREALDEIRVAAMSDYEPDADYLIDTCNAALSAPPRNCDVLSEEEANEAWDEYRHSHVLPRGGWDFHHIIAWLYAKAGGGDHA